MDPEQLLAELCRRHGVPPERGARLLPLVRWALEAAEPVRERILGVVEETLASRALGEESPSALAAANRSLLLAVARVLHDWTPSEGLLGMSGEGGGA
jgi:hypothetical protein